MYNDDSSIYSLAESEEDDNNLENIEIADFFLLIDESSCEHKWYQGKGDSNIECIECKFYPSLQNR